MNRFVLVRIAGIAISVLCLVYVVDQAGSVWEEAGPALLARDTFARMGLALMPALLGFFAAALASVALLRSFGVQATVMAGSGAYLAAQVGKYLPGNVGHYVGRIVLLARLGHPASTATLAMTTEFALLMAIAALLSLPMLDLVIAKLSAAWGARSATRLIFIAAGLVTVAIAVAAIAKWQPGLVRTLKDTLTRLRAPFATRVARRRLAASVLLTVSVFGLTGSSLLVLGIPLRDFTLEIWLQIVSLYSVAWMVGTLTPGLPGGIGVREAILIGGLTPLCGASEAVTSALGFRVLTVFADVLALGFGLAALQIGGDARLAREPR